MLIVIYIYIYIPIAPYIYPLILACLFASLLCNFPQLKHIIRIAADEDLRSHFITPGIMQFQQLDIL